MALITCTCGKSVEIDRASQSGSLRCQSCGASLPAPAIAVPNTASNDDQAQIFTQMAVDQRLAQTGTSGLQSAPQVPAILSNASSRCGPYTVIRPHAQGGMGRVSIAHDEMLKREVALKQLLDPASADAINQRRFVEEAEITGQLEHPGVVPVYALGTDPSGKPFYAMRLVQGHTLARAIDEYHRHRTAAALRELLRRFVMVCHTVAYAHARGVIHRDLKPSNVMLGGFGETLVMDWGLAKPVGERPSSESTQGDLAMRRMAEPREGTREGEVLGTPAYMSPEQAMGRVAQTGPASDIYSLGAVLYQILTGKPAYSGRSSAEVVEQVKAGPPPRISSVASNIPRPLEAICQQAMARQPEARYPAAQGLAADVQNWLDDEPVSAYLERPIERAQRWSRRHKTLVASGALALLVTVLAVSIGAAMVARQQAKTVAAQRLAEDYQQWATDAIEQAQAKEAEADRLAGQAAALRREAAEADRCASVATRSAQGAQTRIVQLQADLKAKSDQARQLGEQLQRAREELAVAQALAVAESQRSVDALRRAELLERQALALRSEAAELRRIAAQSQQLALRATEGESPGVLEIAPPTEIAEWPKSLEVAIPRDPNAPPPAIAPFNGTQALKHQEAWANYLGLPKDHTNSIGMKLVLIPPGEFLMGSSPEEIKRAQQAESVEWARNRTQDEGPQHRVALTRPFFMGIHEVTVAQFRKFVEAAKFITEPERDLIGGAGLYAGFEQKFNWKDCGRPIREDEPVVNITWNDANEFCQWLSHQDGRAYRFPTEAEWEYACRAGTTTQFFCGDEPESLQGYANIADKSHATVFKAAWNVGWDDGYPHAAPVGSFKPNPFGLYDMHGNVEEWCADWWTNYPSESVVDPFGPSEKTAGWSRGQHNIRGGTFFSELSRRRAAFRAFSLPSRRTVTLGFRVVCELTREAEKAAAPPDPKAPPKADAPFDRTIARQHQEAWAKHLGLPRERTYSLGMTFVLIPPGKFEMGSDEIEVARLESEATTHGGVPFWYPALLGSEKPKRWVTITRPFYLSKHETTVGQFRAFLEHTGYKPDRQKETGRWEWFARGEAPLAAQPVSWVTDKDAAAFCQWLSGREGSRYELPTEAEWEYACRAGTATRRFTGNDLETLRGYANLGDASARLNQKDENQCAPWSDGFPATAPVGSFKPNAFGLYDMLGNVFEICADRHDGDFYSHAPAEDPRCDYGPFSVIRGGGYAWVFPDVARCSYRHVLVFGKGHPGYSPVAGFRVALRIARLKSAKTDAP